MTWTDFLGVIAFIAFLVSSTILRDRKRREAEIKSLEKKWKP